MTGSSLQFRVFGRIFFFLIVLSLISNSINSQINTPWVYSDWKDTNPYIENIGESYYYHPPSLENVITELRFANVSSMNLDKICKEKIDKAIESRDLAESEKMECIDAQLYIQYMIGETSSYDLDSVNQICLKPQLTDLSPVSFGFRYLLCAKSMISQMIEAESDLTHCEKYGEHWENTMTNSMQALEYSVDKVNSNYSSLQKKFSELNRSGICDSDYTEAGHSDCLYVKSGISSIESKSIEGSYGGYNILENQLQDLQLQVQKSRPDTMNYSLMMGLIWEENGVLDTIDMLDKKADTALIDAENEFVTYTYTADVGRTNVATLNGKLSGQNLEKIESALSISGSVGSSSTGTIADRYVQLSGDIKEADNLYDGATQARNINTMRGYLKTAINSMKQADSKYASLEISLPILHQDAINVVNEQKKEAASLLAEAKTLESLNATSSYVRGKINLSATYFEQAEKNEYLGFKFELYALSAKEARTAISKNQNQSFDQAAEIVAKKKELLDLIGKAESDKINVFSQKESLNSLNSADYAWVEAKLLELEAEIVTAAYLEYGYLDDMRADLISQIKLVGGDADDLLSDMQKEEVGLIGKDGKIDYRKAIGSLDRLSNKYYEIQSTLDSDIDEIVKNSLMVESEVFVDSVELDKQSSITIDLIIINTEKYSSTNVPADVKLPMSVDLMFSDITSGSDLVGSIVSNGNTAKLYLKKVDPHARQRIVFETNDTIAHTTKVKRTAVGLGDGSALVEEEISFTLDSDINALSIPTKYENALIDGKTPGALIKGKHVLTARYVELDAYNQSIANIKSSSIGLNSQVEYDVEIIPKIDLDSIMFFVDPGAKISNLNVFTLSGESVGSKKKITENRYSFVVSDLTAGNKASVRVSYILENASSYVQSQIILFNDANLSDAVGSLVDEAKAAMDKGDTNGALAKIKEAQALQKKEASDLVKTNKKIEDIKQEINAELDEIETALDQGKTLNSSFMSKLSARSDELERRLSESASKTPNDALLYLESVDLNWKGKEITALRKDMFKEYNDLKERLINAGNTSTPNEFLAVESALNKLEVSGRLEYVVDLIEEMDKAKKLVESSESATVEKLSKLKSGFSILKSSLTDSLIQYITLSDEAKSTEFSSMFKYTESAVNKKITDIEKMFGADEPEYIESKIDSLNKTSENIDDTISLLKSQSANKIDLIEKLFDESKDSFSAEEKDSIEKKIASMKRLDGAGEYVNSLRAGNAILEDLDQEKDADNSLLLLGVTSLAILGVVAAYMFKQKKKKPGPKKEQRRLKKAEDEEEEKQ